MLATRLLPFLLAVAASGLGKGKPGKPHPTTSVPSRNPLDNIVEHPSGPCEEPMGRHIQVLFRNAPHGLTNRIWYLFRPLIALGKYHNATVHIRDGALGPKKYLTSDHSAEIAESWGRYFDLDANGGNPWHEPRNFARCKTMHEAPTNPEAWLHLFPHGVDCVNLEFGPLPPFEEFPIELQDMKPEVVVSNEVRSAAQRFLARYKVQEPYGSCHIRRCDLLVHNQDCTDPKEIAKRVRAERLGSWLVFMYAENGYGAALRARLEPLKKHIVYEDEAVVNDVYPQDNYFTYLVGKFLNGGAERIVETHECNLGSGPPVLNRSQVHSNGLYLLETGYELLNEGSAKQRDAARRYAEADLEDRLFLGSKEAMGAICDGRYRGAKLLTESNAFAGSTSAVTQRHQR